MKKMNKIVVLDEYKSGSEKKTVAPRETKVRTKRLRFRKYGVLKLLGATGLFLALLYLLGCLPFFQVQEIMVEGTTALRDDKAIALSGFKQGDNFFYLDIWDAKKSLKQNPFVENVTIRRTLPNHVTICIKERKSIGYIVTPDGYVQVGEDGRFLAIQQSLSNYNLPVISGVDLSELPAIGGFIENEKLKQALEILQNCDQSLLDNIAELNVGQEYYILAYTNQKLEVRLGGLDQIEQRLEDLNEILTHVVGTQIAADQILYIDMRYEDSPYIKLRS
ncbi:MAG: cell division protein FtsQ/DivIB [Peptococcaceae bacterium]